VSKKKQPETDPEYEAYKDRQAEISRRRSERGREIGDIPPIANVRRRSRCRRSLKAFCETYNPAAFYLGWSDAHLNAIARIEEAATLGALYAFAMARGSGKSTLCRMAALWAVSYGHARYVFLIGATDPKAHDALDSIKTLVRFGETYAGDFPEIAYPVQRLGGIANRSAGQTCGGESTQIEWSGNAVVLPTVPPPENWPKSWPLRSDGKVPTSGAVVGTSGLSGEGIRGSLLTLTTGEMVRPDLVLLDDPQTAESARSRTQNVTREQLVSADVLGMAGPDRAIAAVMPCTVIAPGDFIDNVLDRSKHPLWRGERSGILQSLPTNLTAWDAYFEAYRRCALKEPPDFSESNAHYLAHRAALDEGAEATWADRLKAGEVSAVQHAMNLYCRDRRAFMAEYMNRPEPLPGLGAAEDLDAGEVAKKLNRVPRAAVPPEATRLTAFVDVGGQVLYYAVCAWAESFGGAVIDYGTCPGQSRTYFAAADARPSLADLYPRHDETARVYAGLKATVEAVAGRPYRKADGTELRVELCLVDSGWATETVYQFCRQTPFAATVMPSKGYAIGAGGNPMANWASKPGERVGTNWRLSKARLLTFDPNWWKSFVVARLATPPGGAGSLMLFGESADAHRLFADHLVSEYRVRTHGRGRDVDEWKLRPDRPDNHWFDCLTGCAVAASVLGVKWSAAGAAGEAERPAAAREKVKLSDIQKQKRAAKGATR
jgi:hypothetical protein